MSADDEFEPEDIARQDGVKLGDFLAYMPKPGGYIFKPTRDLWPASSVNARVPPVDTGDGKPVTASTWLAANCPVEQMTWAPGEPLEIEGRLIDSGGWIQRTGFTVFNLYRPPTLVPKPGNVDQWLEHVEMLYGEDALHIINWLAHRVQYPQEKINHALVLGGLQGIGKDTLLEPVKHAVGPWNFTEVSPRHVLGRFNGFVKSVILRVNEARDLGEGDRYTFYDHLKSLTATPPDVLRIDEKHLREYDVINCCGVVITTNHKTDGIYLPADDRRHFVAWSNLTKENFSDSYWNNIWRWYTRGGIEHVAAHLAELDLSAFNAKAPPRKTQAFWEIADASRAPEDSELKDVLDELGHPSIVTVDRVVMLAAAEFAMWLRERKNARRIPYRMEACGYVAVRNPNDTEGRWKINGKRHTIYARAELPERDRLDAAFRYSGTR